MEKLSKLAAEITSKEWQELGFFYISNEELKCWDIYGSRSGLGKLVSMLNQFSLRKEPYGEHQHIGPHYYLTFTSAPSPVIDRKGIWGRAEDFKKLADLVGHKLSSSKIDDQLNIKEEFNEAAEFCLSLHVKDETFNPASLDQQLR